MSGPSADLGGESTGDLATASADMAVNPIVGTWKGMSGIATITWTLSADQAWKSDIVATDPSTSCTTTSDETGTWMTSGHTLTITASSGTVATAGCSDPTMNQSQQPDPNLDTSPKTSTYSINGNTLSDTPMGQTRAVTLTRQ